MTVNSDYQVYCFENLYFADGECVRVTVPENYQVVGEWLPVNHDDAWSYSVRTVRIYGNYFMIIKCYQAMTFFAGVPFARYPLNQ